MSTARLVREHVESRPVRGFISTSAIHGGRRAVECEMSRLAAEGAVVRVRKGLYWKGPKTRLGMPLPRPGEVALEIAGVGSGPAEISAAHSLGLTTQVPAVEVIAVPGRPPAPVRGARFVSRSVERRFLGLRPREVALLEVLRAGPPVIEGPWTEVAKVARRLARAGKIRPDVIDGQVHEERHVATRERWAQLRLVEAVSA
ncbi:MAG: hypothetical protein ACRD0U_19130 [Acidimicrobiales bacterium]